jgi:uncharacterized repeat protein (TIGR01451 family)
MRGFRRRGPGRGEHRPRAFVTFSLAIAIVVVAALAGAGTALAYDDGSADVGVSLTAKPASVTPGQNVEFESIVTNDGPNTATNVELFETLPDSVDFVEATATQGSCEPGEGPSVFCSLGSIGDGGSVTVSVVVTTPSEGFEGISSHVEVSADQFDPNTENNSDGDSAGPCSTECTGGWLDVGGRLDGPPIGDGVTQSATLIAPAGVHGPVSSFNTSESPCDEPPDFETYGKVFIVDGPAATKGRAYLNRFKFVTSEDTSVGVPPHEPLKDVTLLRKCVEIPRCLGRHHNTSSIPSGFEGCVYKVHRDMRTKVVTISELDTGDDPPIRGGG